MVRSWKERGSDWRDRTLYASSRILLVVIIEVIQRVVGALLHNSEKVFESDAAVTITVSLLCAKGAVS